MIDWNRTKTNKGYFNKYPKTRKEVLRICDDCGKEKLIRFCYYSNLCIICSNKKRLGIKFSDETCQKMSESRKGSNNPFYGKHHSDENKEKNRKAHKGKPSPMKGKHHSDESKEKNRIAHLDKRYNGYKLTIENKINMSCSKQGIDRKDFAGFLTDQKYCKLFNNRFKEIIRERYHRKCYLCNKTQKRKLSVHHVNYNKNCLCQKTCEFVPLCQSCHAKTNHNRSYYEDLIMNYLYPERYFMVDI